MIREGLTEKTFQQRPEGGEANQANDLGDTEHSDQQRSMCKGPGVGVSWACPWTSKVASVAGGTKGCRVVDKVKGKTRRGHCRDPGSQ